MLNSSRVKTSRKKTRQEPIQIPTIKPYSEPESKTIFKSSSVETLINNKTTKPKTRDPKDPKKSLKTKIKYTRKVLNSLVDKTRLLEELLETQKSRHKELLGLNIESKEKIQLVQESKTIQETEIQETRISLAQSQNQNKTYTASTSPVNIIEEIAFRFLMDTSRIQDVKKPEIEEYIVLECELKDRILELMSLYSDLVDGVFKV